MPEHGNFFNVDAMEQGIAIELTDGITTRIFAGDQAMVSIVWIEPNASGTVHAHPREQWRFCFRGSVITGTEDWGQVFNFDLQN